MDLKEEFKKHESGYKEFAEKIGNPDFERYGILSDRICQMMLEYLQVDKPDVIIDKEAITGVFFALGITIARFGSVFDSITGNDVSRTILDVVRLSIESIRINKDIIELERLKSKESN